MKLIPALLLAAFGAITASAQDQGPQMQVPPLIAKLPERADFHGEWLRQDGTYKLHVEPKKGGGVKVGYFNPKSINVESAEFIEREGMLSLVVVLRDEGYPGSTYQLMFDPSYRVLAGNYRMPGQGQQHQVYFQKVKQP